ncbi:MAG: acyl-CoA reductase [Clostridiaceae bacterium]|nr:acyl-CoA reductase [Clostridiaceae bacterium]
MNLVDGQIIDAKTCDLVLDTLGQRIQNTLQKKRLDPEVVISACSRLVANLDEAVYLQVITGLGIDKTLGRRYIDEARSLFSGQSLRERLKTELGEHYGQSIVFTPLRQSYSVTEQIMPLGVLFHIAAGNADGLPAFSVLEGLLTGNINILKLPAAEGGVSVRLLRDLIEIEPDLAEYIYVFNYSSRDIVQLSKLIALADAVVMWGGAEAVSALRRLVPPNTRLIEWGHKVSFAYVTARGLSEAGLTGLANNIAETGQLLCSSCQGIFVDTDDPAVIDDFCRRFLPVLETVMQTHAKKTDIGIETQVALQLYCEELESLYQNSRVFKGNSCSLIAYPDSHLNPAIQFGNAWVRALPRTKLLPVLRPYKNYLQTAGLLCGEDERAELTRLLWQSGVVRVCPGERMSSAYNGAPHDGEYPLRRYTRIVCAE